MDRRCRYVEPAIVSVEAAKAYLRHAGPRGLLEITPPGFELSDVVPVDSRFPLRSVQLVRGEARVIPKWLVGEIERTVRLERTRQAPEGHR